MSFPILETERLELNEITSSDVDAIFTIFSNPDVIEYYDTSVFTAKEQAEKLISLFTSRFEKGLGIRWAIRTKTDNLLIGTCGFNSWNANIQNTSLGYELMPSCWGRGYAQESVDAIIKWAFADKLPCGAIHRIQADTVPGNNASEKLLIKLGFKEEGLRRDSGYWKNEFHDLKCFGLLKTDIKDM
ncbi:GNAT family N-acetyltransferase [Pseudoalteromonas sp. APC 3224]|uniref:GNAT family N-acetyltransferase n=1 Tax=Pseudoalteromonas sp. APC 3224 TaxID=3035203 RepID=UPI0025B4AFE4|nr:GNAT family N-acetyltransferase [Pseudoalteromonas sp. APC 3224]MDN3483782.1 GNAT family N-acetyltransferase [Pseudoalteromonas sp. APC 3224]